MISWNRLERTQNTKSFPMLSTWYTQLGAWPNTRRSPVRLATPSARATAEPFSSSVNRAAIKSTRMWKLLMSVFSIWVFPKMVGVLPKSSILIGCSNYKPSILGYPYFWKHPYVYFSMVLFQRWSHSFDGCHSGIGWQLSAMLHSLTIYSRNQNN